MATYSCEFVENHAFTSKYTLGIQRTSLGCTLGGTAGGSTEDPVEQTIMINIWDSSNFTHNIIVFNFTDNNTVIWMDPGRPQRYPRCITKNAQLHFLTASRTSCTFICHTNVQLDKTLPYCATTKHFLTASRTSCTFICRTNITKCLVRHDNALLRCNKALSHSKSHVLYIYLPHKHHQMSSQT